MLHPTILNDVGRPTCWLRLNRPLDQFYQCQTYSPSLLLRLIFTILVQNSRARGLVPRKLKYAAHAPYFLFSLVAHLVNHVRSLKDVQILDFLVVNLEIW